MRPFIIIVLIIFTSIQAYSQKGKKTSSKSPWSDTAFIMVNLRDSIINGKILLIDIGQKATIYVNKQIIRNNASESLPDFNRPAFTRIIKILDSASSTSDTITMDIFTHDLYDIGYLVSEQLQKGNAKVFYKKENRFVPNISHRLEKYGMYAHRFFYLPDKRPFFSVMEYSGIIENGKYHSDYNELIEVAEKIKTML